MAGPHSNEGTWASQLPSLPFFCERTVLRPLQASDAPLLHWILHPEVRRYLPGAPETPERLAEYVAWAGRQAEGDRRLYLAVTVGDRPIGIIHAWALNAPGTTIEWGIALDHARWGDGLMQDSARAFLSYAVARLGVERIEARTAVTNLRAVAALRRLGARCEGPIRGGLADKVTDCFLWSVLAADVTWHDASSRGSPVIELPFPGPRDSARISA